MKLYRFYISFDYVVEHDILNPETYDEEFGSEFLMPHFTQANETSTDYGLYAITTKKSMAKKFRQSRNMDAFKEVVGEIDESGYHDILTEYGDAMLDEYPLHTKGVVDGKYVPISETLIVMTSWENFISTASIDILPIVAFLYDENWWFNMPPLAHIKDDTLRNALNVLEYHRFQRMDVDYDMIYGDELALFLAFFGQLLKL